MSLFLRKVLFLAGCLVIPIAWGLLVEWLTQAIGNRSREGVERGDVGRWGVP